MIFSTRGPYLLTIAQQAIWTFAQQIARRYPYAQQAQYQAAAASLRTPNCHWAQNATMPHPGNDPTITVNTPQGLQTISNPLYTYTFHPLPSAPDFPADDTQSIYHSTLRKKKNYGNSQPDLANQQLQANAQA